MRLRVQPADAEKLVKDFLKPLFTEDEATVGIGVPDGWTPDSVPHIEVASDGVPLATWPICTHTTIRLVARAKRTSDAKALCGKAQGFLLGHNGDGEITGTQFLTGVLPARDPQSNAEIASSTTRVTARTESIETGS